MQTYTHTEIDDDIKRLEGVEVRMKEAVYLKRYSDFYDHQPADDEDTVDDLKERLNYYIAMCAVGWCDIDLTTLEYPTLFGLYSHDATTLYYIDTLHDVPDPGNGLFNMADERGFNVVALIIPDTQEKIMRARPMH